MAIGDNYIKKRCIFGAKSKFSGVFYKIDLKTHKKPNSLRN